MNEIKKSNHHDNRPHNWSVSLSDGEYEAASQLMAESGLCKTAYARQALTKSVVHARIGKQDREQIGRLNKCHASINEIAAVVLKMKKENFSDESLVRYLYKVQHQLDRIESDCADIANYFAALFSK